MSWGIILIDQNEYLPEGTAVARPSRKWQCWSSTRERNGRLRQCRLRARGGHLCCHMHRENEGAAQALRAREQGDRNEGQECRAGARRGK